MPDQEPQDLALGTLMAVAKDLQLNLPEDLIKKAFLIQRRHQFDREPDAAYQDMKNLVNEFAQGVPMSEGSDSK
jgi:hypothetical protein